MNRTFTLIVWLEPTGLISPSWMVRRSFTCMDSGMLAISSRKRVPPSASWNTPGLLLMAPVNAPFHVTEQLALQERLGQPAAVQGHEAPVLPRALGMNGARHQLLPGSALSLDQDVALGARQVLQQLEDLLHPGALADEVLVGVPPIQLLAQRLVLAAESDLLHGLAGQVQQAVAGDRPGDVAEGPPLDGLDRRVDGLVGRDEDHLGRIGQAADGVQQDQPARVG